MNTVALYYPHSELLDEEMLKTVLLLWDQVDILVPEAPWHTPEKGEGVVRDALLLVANFRSPSLEEQQDAHAKIESFVSNIKDGSFNPSWLKQSDPSVSQYEIYKDKFFIGTWDLLEREGLVENKDYGLFQDGAMHESLGLALMGVLASACAGKSFDLVTDDARTFESSTRELVRQFSGSKEKIKLDYRSTLVYKALRIIDATDIPLARLVKIRGEDSAFMARLRENFRNEVQKYQETLTQEGVTSRDIEQYQRGFQKAIERDYEELQDRLHLETKIRAGENLMGGLITALTNPGEALGKLVASIPAGKKERDEILRDHPTAWLYAAKSNFQLV
jgi:hypothetical protein